MEKDPRKRSIKYNQEVSVSFTKIVFDFAPTQFVIDDHYIGEPPEIQVSIENLNDNIDEKFLSNELRKLGELRSVEILKHPQTKAHLGMAKVQFISVRSAQACVETYNNKQLMGRRLNVYKDVKFAIIEENKKEKLNPVSSPSIVPSSRCRLEDRIAVLMRQPNCVLSAIVGPQQAPTILTPPTSVSTPSTITSLYSNNLNNTSDWRRRNNDLNNRETKNYYDRSHSDAADAEERAWNPRIEPLVPDTPPPPLLIPPPPEEPKKEELVLSEHQINECIPESWQKFFDEMKKVLFHQASRKLIIQSHGYRYVDKLQEEHRADQARLKIEQELEKKRLQQEAEARRRIEYEETKRMEHRWVGKDGIETTMAPKPRAIRIRTGLETFKEDSRQDLRRVNRSSAFVSDQRPDSRMSRDSSSRSVSSSSRSVSSESDSDSDSDSESSVSSSLTPSSVSRMSSQSSFGSASPPQPSPPIPSNILTETRKDARVDSVWNNLDILATAATLPQSSKIEPEQEVKEISKKRKRDAKLEERPIKRKPKLDIKTKEEKVQPDVDVDPERKFPMHPPLSEEEIEAIITDTRNISKEDIRYASEVHRDWQAQRQAHDVPVPFGSDAANLAHIEAREQMIDFKKNSDKDPNWWSGCSRCDIININEKKNNDVIETEKHDDLKKAPIESHVIQATLSTKRDLRCDQRRIAALNPDIDPLFLKQFTANTLQMRAKNLRFSRSKIHKWGLFACEKIANGEAVIEYVGEKIRSSLADFREKFTYTNLPTHDGSSYFFRVDSDVIDATLKGNKARFINHSCNPNCFARVIKHDNGTSAIVIYAKQPIDEDEEITYDYKFPREEVPEEEKIHCNCKAPNCQKFLN